TNASFRDYLRQADAVLSHYRHGVDSKLHPPAKRLHYNFMARGEPLSNPLLLDEGPSVLHALRDMAGYTMEVKFLISTILPESLVDRSLHDIFFEESLYPEIYYSIYSVNPEFRRRWLPRALPVEIALEKLVAWQQRTCKIPK